MSLIDIFKKDKSEQEMSGISTEGTTGKVNINELISRHKKKKTQKKTETIIFVSLAFALIIIVGVLFSL